MSDEFVDEIHAVRSQIAKECDHDFEKIGAYFMELQKRFPDRLIRQVPQTEPEIAKTCE